MLMRCKTKANESKFIYTSSDLRIGSLRIIFPVAENTALATAGPTIGAPISPILPCLALLGTR